MALSFAERRKNRAMSHFNIMQQACEDGYSTGLNWPDKWDQPDEPWFHSRAEYNDIKYAFNAELRKAWRDAWEVNPQETPEANHIYHQSFGDPRKI